MSNAAKLRGKQWGLQLVCNAVGYGCLEEKTINIELHLGVALSVVMQAAPRMPPSWPGYHTILLV